MIYLTELQSEFPQEVPFPPEVPVDRRKFRPSSRFQSLASQFSDYCLCATGTFGLPPEVPARVAFAHNRKIWEPFKWGSSSPSWALAFFLVLGFLSPPLLTLKRFPSPLSLPMILSSF